MMLLLLMVVVMMLGDGLFDNVAHMFGHAANEEFEHSAQRDTTSVGRRGQRGSTSELKTVRHGSVGSSRASGGLPRSIQALCTRLSPPKQCHDDSVATSSERPHTTDCGRP
uniref:Secreted protein n=1 Tax=Plectus sambesii TaxID=2011161 RepID=A0A914WDV5_9BILA